MQKNNATEKSMWKGNHIVTDSKEYVIVVVQDI